MAFPFASDAICLQDGPPTVLAMRTLAKIEYSIAIESMLQA
jgi:hypothetical protein